MKFVYSCTLYLPLFLTLNTPFPLYLSTILVFAELYLHSSAFTLSEMLLIMTQVDKADVSSHVFEYTKIKNVNNSLDFNC